MYQLGTVSLGAGSRMDLVPVGGKGRVRKAHDFPSDLHSVREAAQALCPLSRCAVMGGGGGAGRLEGALCYAPL